MKTNGAVGIPTILILITSLFLAGTIATALLDNTLSYNSSNPQDITMDAVNEISTYLQVKDIIGQYSSTTRDAHITKIVLLISPLFSQQIDLRALTIQLNDGKNLHVLSYGEQAHQVADHSVFSHPLWETTESNTFTCISTHDKDQSITLHHTLNSQTDTAFLILPLPNVYNVQKDTFLEITLYPGTGVQRTFVVHPPMALNSVVSLQ